MLNRTVLLVLLAWIMVALPASALVHTYNLDEQNWSKVSPFTGDEIIDSIQITINYHTPPAGVTRPPSYMNPNASYSVWWSQNSTTYCSVYAAIHAYAVFKNQTSGGPVYKPLYYMADFSRESHYNRSNYTALAEVAMKHGFTQYTLFGSGQEGWDQIKQLVYEKGQAVIEVHTFTNQYPEDNLSLMYPEPNGDDAGGHYMAAVRYSDDPDAVYFVDSRNASYWAGYKIRGISHDYWMTAGVGGFAPY